MSGILICAACVAAAGQNRQNGPGSACVRCHAAQATSQPRTPMGRAVELPGANPTLKAHPKMTFRKGAYSYTVTTVGDQSTYSVTDGVNTISLPIRWSFGTGGQTWVLEHEGHFYDSLVSYYPGIEGLEITMGDEQITPSTLEEAVGKKLTPTDARACFRCHTTNSELDGKLTLESMQPGVTCEHCHAGTNAHLLDALQGDYSSAPPKLGKLSSEDISNFCGQCHRTWETVLRNHFQGEINVRFQPYRLANSKCFDGADPRISCLACHDPHQDFVRQDSFYDPKCLSCHAVSAQSASAVAPGAAHACPVAKTNCVSCHMPKVNLPGGHMAFTDHEIRVVKPGEPYPN
jgi:hypothetical protein